MKKLLALLLVMVLCLSFVACGGDNSADNGNDDDNVSDGSNDNGGDNTDDNDDNTDDNIGDNSGDNSGDNTDDNTQGGNTDDNDDNNTQGGNTPDTEKSEGVATHAEYVAAENGTTLTVECYVQGHQSWWDNKITVYAQDADGGYLFYEMACSEEDAAKLTPGTKIRVTGEKAEYKGELELMGATFEFVDGANTYVANPVDVSEVAIDDLSDYMNMKAVVKGFTVVGYKGGGNAFRYKDGVMRGDDIYFQLSDGKNVYNMTIEKYLTDENTEVYAAVEALKVGDIVDVEFFAYWYEGLDAHVTSVTVNGNVYNEKSEGVATHAEYVAAENGTTLTVECYVQGHQSWWDNKITVYAQDADGGYLFYEMACSEEDAANLTPGTKIRVTGEKAEYKGELELMGATFEFVEGANTYVANPVDVSEVAIDDLSDYMNMKAVVKGFTVVGYKGGENAFQYKDGIMRGDDIYFQLSDGENVYNMTVEKYLTDENSEVYAAVEALEVGDIVDVEFFAYWYEGLDAHVSSVTVKTPEA